MTDMAKTKHYYPGLERLRLILMLLMCIRLFGFPTAIGGWVEQFCGFVPIAFYILSGFLFCGKANTAPKGSFAP